jgi:hypothetical protein
MGFHLRALKIGDFEATPVFSSTKMRLPRNPIIITPRRL